MTAALKGNNDGTAAIQVGGVDAIKIDANLVSTGKFTSNIQPITASVAANALTITLNPTSLSFRSSTLGSGTVNNRQVTTAISLTISSGSTLGTVNAQQSRIVVLAIDNAGTVELAAVNISGGNQLDETNLITTTAEGGAGAADSANVIYSQAARTSVPYRVVGYVESTQATAGTWATTPSTIQGQGGQALAAMSSVGYGQTWQSVTRAAGTTYYNTTGKPIMLMIYAVSAASGNMNIVPTINGVSTTSIGGSFANAASNTGCQGNMLIPVNASYSFTLGNCNISNTYELR